MNKEEIVNSYSMEDILAKYGLHANRSHMLSCPFHGRDKRPSMKIFKNGYKCFACGAGGDIFSFIQNMDNCDFKTAFYSLGGTYEHDDRNDFKAQLARKRVTQERDRQKKERQKLIDEKKQLLIDIDWLSDLSQKTVLYPKTWCFVMNERERLFDRLDELTERGV